MLHTATVDALFRIVIRIIMHKIQNEKYFHLYHSFHSIEMCEYFSNVCLSMHQKEKRKKKKEKESLVSMFQPNFHLTVLEQSF